MKVYLLVFYTVFHLFLCLGLALEFGLWTWQFLLAILATLINLFFMRRFMTDTGLVFTRPWQVVFAKILIAAVTLLFLVLILMLLFSGVL